MRIYYIIGVASEECIVAALGVRPFFLLPRLVAQHNRPLFLFIYFRRASERLLFRDKVRGQSSWLTPGGNKRVP